MTALGHGSGGVDEDDENQLQPESATEAEECRAPRSPRPAHRPLCVPSQNGLPAVCLQPHSQTSSLAAAVNGTGVSPVP